MDRDINDYITSGSIYGLFPISIGFSSNLKNTIFKFDFKGMCSVYSFDQGRNVFNLRQKAPKLHVTWVDANCMVSIFSEQTFY